MRGRECDSLSDMQWEWWSKLYRRRSPIGKIISADFIVFLVADLSNVALWMTWSIFDLRQWMHSSSRKYMYQLLNLLSCIHDGAYFIQYNIDRWAGPSPPTTWWDFWRAKWWGAWWWYGLTYHPNWKVIPNDSLENGYAWVYKMIVMIIGNIG